MAKAGTQVPDEQVQPQRHLQRPQKQGKEHDRRVEADPHRDGGLDVRRRRRVIPVLVEREPAAERVVDGAGMEIGELLALRQQRFALVGDQPAIQVGGAVVAVQGGPLLLHAFDGPEQLGSAKPGKPALGDAEAVLPVEELLDVVLADTMADRHRHQRIRLP